MKKTLLTERFQELAGIKSLSKQDDLGDELGSAMAKGFDDDFGSFIDSDDRFPGEDEAGMAPRYSPFAAKAKDYTEKFKQEYREMSDDGIDEFNKEIIEYLLNAFPSAQATAKVFFAKKGI